MPIDREAALKQAEKLLRQGRLDGAIAEYVRLLQEQPTDWTSVNALGDLYVRAGKTDKAIEQFTWAADHLMAEGFLPRASALYKKILRVRGDDEPTLLLLAEIATRQGLLADAKHYLKQVGERRRARGDARGAAEIVIRLGTLDPEDPEGIVTAARAARQVGDVKGAASLLADAAAVFKKRKRVPEAVAALAEALETDPSDQPVRVQLVRTALESGDDDRVREYLTPESAGDDPRLLLILARRDLRLGRAEDGRAALTRLLSCHPDRHTDAVAVGCELAEQGMLEAAYTAIDLVVDLALLNHDWAAAASALQAFTALEPRHIPALMKLVEICVDANFTAMMVAAQQRLADAYLDTGRATQAMVIAEDLVTRDPSAAANVERLRRALVLLNEPDPDAVIARRLGGTDGDVPMTAEDDQAADPDVITLESVEVDLSDVLAGLTAAFPDDAGSVPDATGPAPDLEEVFEDLRARAVSGEEARRQYDEGVAHMGSGQIDAAIAAFQSASRVPVMRFEAASALGRLHVQRGDLGSAVEWLERAADAPAPTPEQAHALLFDLADALERLGESARALAVLLELDADAPGYRDVAARVDRLSRVQTGS